MGPLSRFLLWRHKDLSKRLQGQGHIVCRPQATGSEGDRVGISIRQHVHTLITHRPEAAEEEHPRWDLFSKKPR